MLTVDPSLVPVQVVTAHHEALDAKYEPKTYKEYCYWEDVFRFLPRVGDAIYHDHLIFKVERVILFPVFPLHEGVLSVETNTTEDLDLPTLVVSYVGTHIEIQQQLGLRTEDEDWGKPNRQYWYR